MQPVQDTSACRRQIPGGPRIPNCDAAHVNNPIGGLVLNCGIHDAMELADTLNQVVIGGADESLLDRYDGAGAR